MKQRAPRFKYPPEFGSRRKILDPGPPVWERDRLPGEQDLDAVFRRYPVKSHKPRFDEPGPSHETQP